MARSARSASVSVGVFLRTSASTSGSPPSLTVNNSIPSYSRSAYSIAARFSARRENSERSVPTRMVLVFATQPSRKIVGGGDNQEFFRNLRGFVNFLRKTNNTG